MNNQMRAKPVQMLLVEDNPGDVRLTRETLKDAKLIVDLHVVGDGVEAMAFLHQEGKYASAPHPDLVLLDLNLPRKDGREVLAEIKRDPNLRRIPVVVLTISSAEEDILKSYNLHANAYVNKPLNLEQFAKITKAIEDFWFTVVKLPPNGK
jgi:chemotaxis family two-component system response regulator Rcp1